MEEVTSFVLQDEQLFEYNARNQITLWGPNGEIVDYANKQWSGKSTPTEIDSRSLVLTWFQESYLISCFPDGHFTWVAWTNP